MKLARIFIALVVAAVGIAATAITPASAAERWLNIHNNSGRAIYYAYMSPRGPYGWGRDLLGSSVISAGYQMQVDPDQILGCVYNLRIQFDNGRTLTSGYFDACTSTDAYVQNGRIYVE
jgi:hypothetical protein